MWNLSAHQHSSDGLGKEKYKNKTGIQATEDCFRPEKQANNCCNHNEQQIRGLWYRAGPVIDVVGTDIETRLPAASFMMRLINGS